MITVDDGSAILAALGIDTNSNKVVAANIEFGPGKPPVLRVSFLITEQEAVAFRAVTESYELKPRAALG